MMKLTDHPHRPWRGIIQTLTLAVAAVGLLIPIEAAAQGLTTHDANMASQHQSQSGQLTTHDGNQTSQHNALSQKIDNLSTGADHRGLPQNWDKTLPDNDGPDSCHSSRFTCVMGGAAVRDNETGLVWEQSPDTEIASWALALSRCINKNVGGRKGWRLPSIPELLSLVDPNQTNPTNPALPAGHPFTNVQPAVYWSASTIAFDPTLAWGVVFIFGGATAGSKGSATDLVWCVRGGMNADQY